MPRRHLLLCPLVFALAAGAAGAQTPGGDPETLDCPKGRICVPFEGTVVEINPRYGAACYVVEIRTVTTETLAGTEEAKEAECALFVASGETYVLAAEAVRLTPEQAAVAEIGEPLTLKLDAR